MKLLNIIGMFALVAVVAGCGGAVGSKLGGNLTGLSSGSKLVLVNSGNNEQLTLTTNGDFSFTRRVDASASYNVAVQSQPTGMACTITNGSGTAPSSGADINNIQVTCTVGNGTLVSVVAQIVGLKVGNTLGLLNQGTDLLTVTRQPTDPNQIDRGFSVLTTANSVYSITVQQQPAGQTCTVNNGNGTGTVPATGNANVPVSCV